MGPEPPTITSAHPVSGWTEQQFVRAIRALDVRNPRMAYNQLDRLVGIVPWWQVQPLFRGSHGGFSPRWQH